MTAILGFNYLGGVLMMADTEESLGGDSKSECDKLYRFTFPYEMRAGTVITGGAGDSHLIECANQEMQQFFATGGLQAAGSILQPTDILDALNSFAGNYFQDVITPMRGFAYEPSLEMIIAVQLVERSLLFCWKRNRVVWIPTGQHVSIGLGVILLHPLLRDVQFSASEESMFFHGIRMMFHTKRAVVGVGGKTESISLHHDGTTHYFGTEAAQKTEELVINFEHFVNAVVYLNISSVATDAKNLDENVQKSLADLPRLLNMYRDAYKKILAPHIGADNEDS